MAIRKRPGKTGRGTGFFGNIVFCVLMALFMWRAGYQVYTLVRVHQETVRTQQKIQQLKAENARLEQEKANLNDPQYIEKVARDEHHMVGKKVIPLFLVDDSQKDGNGQKAAKK